MAKLQLQYYPAEVLRAQAKKITRVDSSVRRLAQDMLDTMYANNGVGLAAPQVAKSKRLFVMDCSGGEDPSQKIAVVNPEIVHTEGAQIGEEGCLSFPGIFQKIQRNQRTIVRGQDVAGNWFELDGGDLTARCVLHETDHCDGIVFLDRMTPLKRELAKRKIKKLQRTGEWD